MSEEYKPFSELYGYKPPKLVQHKKVDRDLLNALWNVLSRTVYYYGDGRAGMWLLSSAENMHTIWCDFMKRRIDDFPFDVYDSLDDAPYFGNAQADPFARFISDNYFAFSKNEWSRVFDFFQFLLNKGHFTLYDPDEPYLTCNPANFVGRLNHALKRENSAYRIINNLFIEIISEREVEEVEKAHSVPFKATKRHIDKAITFFATRPNPDYENSIKESISAVESIAKEITGVRKASLGKLTKRLNLPPAFAGGLHKLYGFTNDAGIRHGGTSDKDLTIDQDTARFMLVICSAFVNYIISLNPQKVHALKSY